MITRFSFDSEPREREFVTFVVGQPMVPPQTAGAATDTPRIVSDARTGRSQTEDTSETTSLAEREVEPEVAKVF